MFITFEGPDGSGKTTQSKLLLEYFEKQGKKVLWTREPGGTELGKRLRNMLLEDKSLKVDSLAELLLFCADRAQHIREVIKPALEESKIVICDRYIDSTTAYQCGGRGFPKKMIEDLNIYSTDDLMPDITILVDVPVEIGLKRATRLGSDKFEAEKKDFHNRVRNMYLELAKNQKRIRTYDGTLEINNVFQQIIKNF